MQRFTTVALALAATAGSLAAQGTFTTIGPGRAEGISPDGTWVVGEDFSAGNAWVWSAGTGQNSIGGSMGLAISADGQTVWGEDAASPTQAEIYNGGVWTSLGGVAATGCPDLSNPYDMDDSGTVGVGLGWNGCSAGAFKWTPGGGMTLIGELGTSSRANVVSGDGQWIGGWDQGSNRRASLWDPTLTETLILLDPAVNPTGLGEVWGLSSDGSIATGSGSSTLGAFYWTAAGGPVYIGNLPGVTGAIGFAVSDDGNTIVGLGGGGGPFGPPPAAFIWTAAGGMQDFGAFLAAAGIAVPPGVSITSAIDMTPDGKTIVGTYDTGSFTPESAFILQLADPCGAVTYGQGAAPANYMAMSASGSSSIGGTLTLNTFSVPPVGLITGVSLAAGNVPLLGGVILVDPLQIFLYLSTPVVGSTATTNIPIPADPSLIGVDFFFQSGSPDAGQPGGWALSNGVQLTTCP